MNSIYYKSYVIVIILFSMLLLMLIATQLHIDWVGGSPTKSIIYHTEGKTPLKWLLSTVCPLGKIFGIVCCLIYVLIAVFYVVLRHKYYVEQQDEELYNHLDIVTGSIVISFTLVGIIIAVLMNKPLFIRLVPVILFFIIYIIVLFEWPNYPFNNGASNSME